MKKDLRWVNPHQLKHYQFNWEKAYNYAKLMEQGEKFPPVRVQIDENGEYQVKNGAHRTVASKLVGIDVLVEVEHFEFDEWEHFEKGYKIK